MRFPSLVAFALVSALSGLASVGCTKPTVIGTACTMDKDCNVEGQVCVAGYNGGPSICTKKCTSNTGAMGCPIGFDCYPVDPAKGSTCTKSLYEVDATTGKPKLIGLDCSTSNDVCLLTGSTNPAQVCRRIPDESSDPPVPVDFDPNAYCSGQCANDNECPLDFYCDTDYDMKMRCLRRTFCSPCTVDLNCPSEFPICVPTKDGKSRYCTKACGGTGDCGGVQNSAQTCGASKSAAGADVQVCLHRFGACVGEGNICDPCRKKEDCAKTSASCIFNSATKEGFCSKRCTNDNSCAGGTVPSGCDNTDIASQANPNGMSLGICNGDPSHTSPGLFSCWLPE